MIKVILLVGNNEMGVCVHVRELMKYLRGCGIQYNDITLPFIIIKDYSGYVG